MESDLGGLSGTKRDSEEIGSSDSAMKRTRVSEMVDDDREEKEEEPVVKVEIDLNVSIMEEENGVDNWEKCNEIECGFDLNGSIIEVVDISSDDEDEDDKDLDLQLGFNDGVGSSSMNSKRRYTREEKGKAKIDDSLSLSLGSKPLQVDFNLDFELDKADQVSDNIAVSLEHAELLMSITSVIEEQKRKMIETEETERVFRIEKARDYAHFNHENEFSYKYERQEKKVTNEMKTEEIVGPFSTALKAITDRNTKQRAEELIEWNGCRSKFQPRHVPSLLDLSLDVLVKHADAISSLDHVSEGLKQRLTNLLCDKRRMDVHILELLCKGSPTEIRVKDCSWMTGKQLVDTLGESDMKNLRVLQLDYCGQCSFDNIIRDSIAKSSNSMPCLAILSLKGSGCLSHNTLKPLLVSAPFLQSINLSYSTIITSDAVKLLADSLKSNLKELYIDHCSRVDAMCSLPSIIKFDCLEVLSVAGIQTVCDEFLVGIAAASGEKFKELNLAYCVRLTNKAMEAIRKFCPRLCVLDISNLHHLTDLALCYLANGCRSLESLNITRCEFSDEAVAAFLETSGASLRELSLNRVRQVSFNTVFSLVKCSRNLVSLDLSWCRGITDEALGFIVDNCLSLKQLKIFGCTQITDSFLLSDSTSKLQIVGRDLAPLLERVNVLEPMGVLLHHSPLDT